MTQAEALAQKVRRLALNRQGTEAQVFLPEGFLYLRADGFARFAQGPGAEALSGFALARGELVLCFSDGSALTLRHRLGRLERRVTSRRACPPPRAGGFCR